MVEPVPLDSVIIRFGGELWLKKTWTKRYYTRRLISNIKQMLKHHHVECEVIRRHDRIYLKTRNAVEAAREMSRVFGINSVSPALEIGSTELGQVVDTSVLLARHVLRDGDRFAVRCRRVGRQSYSSRDVCNEVGQKILENLGDALALTVDLEHPNRVLGVEVRDDKAFVYSENLGGAGGMPLGTQGRVVCLVDHDVESVVAGWLAMKRGCPLVPLHFDCTSSADKAEMKKGWDKMKILFDWAVGFPRRLRVAPFQDILGVLAEIQPQALAELLCCRVMYRVAERVADQVGAEGLVTGEEVGEATGQTLWNLRVSEMAVKKYPLLRPLIGLSKAEVEGLARLIGVSENTCVASAHDAIAGKPAIKVELEEIVEAEADLNIDKLIARCVDELLVVDL